VVDAMRKQVDTVARAAHMSTMASCMNEPALAAAAGAKLYAEQSQRAPWRPVRPTLT